MTEKSLVPGGEGRCFCCVFSSCCYYFASIVVYFFYVSEYEVQDASTHGTQLGFDRIRHFPSLLFTIHPPDGPLSLFPPTTLQLHPSTHLFPFHLLSLTPSSALQRFNRPFSIHPSARSCNVPLSSCWRTLPLQLTSEIPPVLSAVCGQNCNDSARLPLLHMGSFLGGAG